MHNRLVSLLLLLAAVAKAEDVLVLSNGDRLRGEIKRMENEVITFSTDYSDSDFQIKWEKVVRVESPRKFLVESFAGERLSGSLAPEAGASAKVGDQKLDLPEMSLLRPFETAIWSRFDWGFDLGYSMTKANGVRQLTIGSNLAYNGERSLATLSANAFFNRQANAPRTRRWEVSPEYRYLFSRAWFAAATADLFSSEEQRLDLRSTIGGGIGRYFARSSTQHLALFGGAAWTSEKYSDENVPDRDSGELFIGVEYRTERLRIADLITRAVVLPSITLPGRYRVNFKVDLDFKLPGDWYMKSGYYNNFDSRPPTSLSRNDFGWKNSFGYEF